MATWPITSLWLVAALGATSGLLMMRAAPRWGSHRGRATALALLLLASGAFVNDYFGYLPQIGDVAGPRPWPVVGEREAVQPFTQDQARNLPRGAVVAVPVDGTHSGMTTRTALAYLPPQYFTKPTLRFPVLYMLHGSPGVPLDWFRAGEAADAGLASARAGHPIILVAPRMSKGWLDDSECVDRPGFAAESYLTLDVIPAIDALLRTRSETSSRGVIGNSAGGYCALAIGLRHPELFAGIIALSPVTAPTFTYGSLADLFGTHTDLRRVVQTHTPAWLLVHRPASRSVAVRFDVGRQDPLLTAIRKLAALDRKLDGNAELIVRAGGHTFRTWRPAIRDAVAWFAARSA